MINGASMVGVLDRWYTRVNVRPITDPKKISLS